MPSLYSGIEYFAERRAEERITNLYAGAELELAVHCEVFDFADGIATLLRTDLHSCTFEIGTLLGNLLAPVLVLVLCLFLCLRLVVTIDGALRLGWLRNRRI